MEYSKELINKIYNDKTISDKIKIEKLLDIDCYQYVNSGNTKETRSVVKKNSIYIYKTIKKIDDYTGCLLINHLD
jgi:hypothetical protein